MPNNNNAIKLSQQFSASSMPRPVDRSICSSLNDWPRDSLDLSTNQSRQFRLLQASKSNLATQCYQRNLNKMSCASTITQSELGCDLQKQTIPDLAVSIRASFVHLSESRSPNQIALSAALYNAYPNYKPAFGVDKAAVRGSGQQAQFV